MKKAIFVFVLVFISVLLCGTGIAHTTAYIQNRSGTAAKFEESTVRDLTSNGYDPVRCKVSTTINNALVYNFRQTQHSGEIVYENSGADLNNPDIYCYTDYYD